MPLVDVKVQFSYKYPCTMRIKHKNMDNINMKFRRTQERDMQFFSKQEITQWFNELFYSSLII